MSQSQQSPKVHTIKKGTRTTKRSAGEWRPVFLRVLRNSANVRAACQAAGIDRKTAYNHRDRDDEFRQQWQDALDDACDILEAEAWQRARAKSDLLMIFLLKARRPELYRETTRHEVTGANGKPITVQEIERTRQKRWQEAMPTLMRAFNQLVDEELAKRQLNPGS